MKIIVRPIADLAQELELTDLLVSAIADEIWASQGRSAPIDWLEVECRLHRLARDVRNEAQDTEVVVIPQRPGVAGPRHAAGSTVRRTGARRRRERAGPLAIGS